MALKDANNDSGTVSQASLPFQHQETLIDECSTWIHGSDKGVGVCGLVMVLQW